MMNEADDDLSMNPSSKDFGGTRAETCELNQDTADAQLRELGVNDWLQLSLAPISASVPWLDSPPMLQCCNAGIQRTCPLPLPGGGLARSSVPGSPPHTPAHLSSSLLYLVPHQSVISSISFPFINIPRSINHHGGRFDSSPPLPSPSLQWPWQPS